MRAPARILLTIFATAAASCSVVPDRGAATGAARHGEDTVFLRVAEDPTITFKVWFPTGSWRDPEGKEGLAWITGKLIEHGSTTRNSYETILEKLYPLASSYSVRVDREMTVLSGRTHTDNLDTFFELFTDAYLHPAFSDDDFKRIRTDTLNYLENALRYSQDEELGKAAFQASVFEGGPLAHPPQGTVQGISSLTTDDVRGFYERHYTGRGAIVALGGGFDEHLEERFRDTLRHLPEGEALEGEAEPAADFEGRHLLLVRKPDADASISFGFPIDVRRGTRDFYALWIANSWLGEHRNSSSHLYQVIREKRGMNYGDYSYIEAFPEGGRRSFPPTHVGRSRQNFEVWIRTLPNGQAHFALRAAIRELTLLVDRGMTSEQFELTRDFLKKYVLHFADTTAARLGYAVDDRFYGIDHEGHLARFRRMMDEIEVDEVNAAIRRHLQSADLKIAIVTGDADTLANALVSDAPSPMTYASDKSPEILAEDEQIASFPLEIARERVRIVEVESIFDR